MKHELSREQCEAMMAATYVAAEMIPKAFKVAGLDETTATIIGLSGELLASFTGRIVHDFWKEEDDAHEMSREIHWLIQEYAVLISEMTGEVIAVMKEEPEDSEAKA